MQTFGQEIKRKSQFSNEKIISLRYDLIKELDELKEAIKEDALTDILYVTYGAGHAFAINNKDIKDWVQLNASITIKVK